jgi:hypothetical protein
MELKILLRSYPGMQQLWSVALLAAYSDAREFAAAETGRRSIPFLSSVPIPGK